LEIELYFVHYLNGKWFEGGWKKGFSPICRWPNIVNMARAEGIEPSAYGFGDRRSTS
jgi:hypothetical protein